MHVYICICYLFEIGRAPIIIIQIHYNRVCWQADWIDDDIEMKLFTREYIPFFFPRPLVIDHVIITPYTYENGKRSFAYHVYIGVVRLQNTAINHICTQTCTGCSVWVPCGVFIERKKITYMHTCIGDTFRWQSKHYTFLYPCAVVNQITFLSKMQNELNWFVVTSSTFRREGKMLRKTENRTMS